MIALTFKFVFESTCKKCLFHVRFTKKAKTKEPVIGHVHFGSPNCQLAMSRADGARYIQQAVSESFVRFVQWMNLDFHCLHLKVDKRLIKSLAGVNPLLERGSEMK